MKVDEASLQGGNGVSPQVAGRLEGSITGWETERGFGWVAHEGGSLFAHIREFKKGFLPRVGDEVTFEMGLDPKGRPCAKAVVARRKDVLPSMKAWLKLMPLLVLPFWASWTLPVAVWMVPVAMVPVSVAAWILYRHDKGRAFAGRWRVSETELHGLEFFGGWPGAFLAQQKFRHKTRKFSYQAIFWAIVFLYQVVAVDIILGGLLFYEVEAFLKEWMTPSV